MNETNVKNYKSYVIHTEDGVHAGLFFRNPIQKIDFDAYGEAEEKCNAWSYLNKINNNPLKRLLEIIIGNKDIINHINEWSNDCDWGGFSANIIVSPVYFKRSFRKLEAYAQENENIKSIKSYGFEKPYNFCGGSCDYEHTVIKLRNGKTIRIVKRDSYNYTYAHIVEKIIDTGEINDKISA